VIPLPEVKCGNCQTILADNRITQGGKYCSNSCQSAAKAKRHRASQERTPVVAMNHNPATMRAPMNTAMKRQPSALAGGNEITLRQCPVCHRRIKEKHAGSLPHCSTDCAERARVIALVAKSLDQDSRVTLAHQSALSQLQAKYDQLCREYETMSEQRDTARQNAALASALAIKLIHDSAVPVPDEVLDFLQVCHEPTVVEVAAWQ